MPAGIVEEADAIVGAAHHQQRPAADAPRQEIPRLRQLALMPGIEPAAIEDALLLVAKELRIAIDLRAEAEDARFLILDEKGIDTVPAVRCERVHGVTPFRRLAWGDPYVRSTGCARITSSAMTKASARVKKFKVSAAT